MELRVTLTAETKIFDLTEAVGGVEITDSINQSGVCSFYVARNRTVTPAEGNAVRIESGGVCWFAGYLVRVAFTHEQLIRVTAYDQLFYLKAQETFVFENKTLTGITQEVCGQFGLRSGKLEETGCPLGRLSFDGKSVLDILSDCRKLTTTKTKQIFYFKDEAGKVVLRNIKSSVSSLLIDPESLLFGYSYGRSIEDAAFNQIKLVRDNKQTGKRELYIAKDSETIKKWGLLQYYEKLDDAVNPEQAKEKADALLFLKNRVAQTLSLDVLGAKEIRAGNLLPVTLPEIGVKEYLLCVGARHTFSNTAHTAKVTLRLV